MIFDIPVRERFDNPNGDERISGWSHVRRQGLLKIKFRHGVTIFLTARVRTDRLVQK